MLGVNIPGQKKSLVQSHGEIFVALHCMDYISY